MTFWSKIHSDIENIDVYNVVVDAVVVVAVVVNDVFSGEGSVAHKVDQKLINSIKLDTLNVTWHCCSKLIIFYQTEYFFSISLIRYCAHTSILSNKFVEGLCRSFLRAHFFASMEVQTRALPH